MREKVPGAPLFLLLEAHPAYERRENSWPLPTLVQAPAQNAKIDSRCHLMEGKHGGEARKGDPPGRSQK